MALTKLFRGSLLLLSVFCAVSVRTAQSGDLSLQLPSATQNRDQTWISLKTSHFEMYTTNSEQQARATLAALEDVRSFFEQTTSLIQPDSKTVRIIAFRSLEEYAPFRLQRTSFAHYLHSRRGEYIVLQDISPDHRHAAIHEYTHYIFRMAGFNLPIWLCEGTADFYSSLVTDGGHSVLGGVLSARLRSLNGGALIPLSTLFAVNHNSPFYNDPAQVSLFYAQSWALVHMLAFHPQYRTGFPKFLQAVSSGISTPEALQQIFGKSEADVNSDLLNYLPQLGVNRLAVQIAPVTHEEPGLTMLSEVQSALTMADLLAAHRATALQARVRLEKLADRNPGNPEAEELLGYLAAQEAGTRTTHEPNSNQSSR